MLYLINPKRKGGRMAARKKKRATPAQLRALAKARRAKKAKVASKKRAGKKAAATRKRKTTRRKSTARRKTTTRRKPVARKRTTRRRTTRRRSPRRRAARSRGRTVSFRPIKGRAYVRNPRFTMKGIGRTLQQGVIDASGVVIGKAATRMVTNFIPFGGQGAMALAKQGVAAIVVGMVANRFMGPQYGRFVLAGGLAAPVETFLQGLPVIGPAISGGNALGEYLGVAALPIGEYVEEGTMFPQDVADAPVGEYVEMFP